MTREELKKAFEELERQPLRLEPVLYFSSQEQCDQFFEDLRAFITAPLEGAANGGHDVSKLEEERLLVHGEPTR